MRGVERHRPIVARHRVGRKFAMNVPTIRFRDVGVAYDDQTVLRGVTGAFKPGSLTAIVGVNGSGKSTLLKALMGELPLREGTIDSGGLRVRDFGYLPQASQLDRQFPITVADTVLMGSWRRTGAFGAVKSVDLELARRALNVVGLEGFEAKRLDALSGGQFQRVLFARLFMQDSRVIILDEPFAAIDEQTTRDLFGVVRRWHAEKRTVIAVLHGFEKVREYFSECLLLARDMIGWGPTAPFFPRKIYGWPTCGATALPTE